MPNVRLSHLTAIVLRWAVVASFVPWVLAPGARAQQAQPATADSINGVYNGTYAGENGIIKFKLSITQQDNGVLAGVFTLYLPDGAGTKAYTRDLTGFTDSNRTFLLANGKWATPPPSGFEMKAGLNGQFDPAGGNGAGTIAGKMRDEPRPKFQAIRDADASAKTASVPADKKEADPSARPIAQPGPTPGTPGAPGPSSTAAAARTPVGRPVFEGVYDGTFPDKQGPHKFKLTLWSPQEMSTAGSSAAIAGLLTAFASDASGTMAYTSELSGFYIAANRVIQVTTRGWEPPLSGVTLMAGFVGKFDPGGGGNAAPQISGSLSDGAHTPFLAIRDAAESDKMDVERLRRHVHPGIVGVFNGTYTRDTEPPTRFKLTITHNGATPELDGMATVYLPVASGTKAYSYDLSGVETNHGQFQLQVRDWVTPPPPGFANFRAMGFNGKVVLGETFTTARISSTPPPQSTAGLYLPRFEATYDEAESADLNGTLAAQKAVGDADEVAALKVREQTLKNASPKQLASKDLVRKSRQYWDLYETRMIREVFDGGFGAAIDENEQFQQVFCTYVEMFSAKYSDCLPADRQTVAITRKTNRRFDDSGQLISEDTQTFNVEMDPRFVDKYRQFHASLTSKGGGLRGAMPAMQPGGVQHILHDLLAVATDMERFFADHGGKSAAMRQLNENLLRGITGEPSLQQAGGKIDGAEAESDKDVPPGRYARFVDAANTYFRERARANPAKFGGSSSHDTALCQRLAELYESAMSPEEDYYYANDFEGRYLPIMGTRADCPDPAWPRLHPAVERAIEEVK